MASEVDVCNLALANIGDEANVSSIDPPEGSVQAEHCARFYPLARDAVLASHAWGFALRRVHLTLLSDEVPGWWFAYAVPSDALLVHRVTLPTSDTAQGFVLEQADDGTQRILANTDQARAHYTARVEDPGRFSASFVETVGWKLSAMLAGPIIKGAEGRAEAQRCEREFRAALGRAAAADSSQRLTALDFTPSSIAARA